MKTIIDKSLILNKLKALKKFTKDTELAEFLGISRSTLSNWYSRNSIDFDVLFSKCEQSELNVILNFTDSSVQSANDLDNNESPQEVEDDVIYLDDNREPEVFFNDRTKNKYLIYPDGTIRIEVLKIPFVAYASYVECFDDEARLNQEFSTITFEVDHIGRGKYLGFKSKGNSMWNNGGYDTPSGADILARQIGRHLWMNGFHKSKYGFILVTNKGIYHKDIEKINEEGKVILTSRNPSNDPFECSLNDIREIYHVIKRSF